MRYGGCVWCFLICLKANDARLLFGKCVSYLVSKKSQKEKQMLGSARKEKERDSRKELKDKELKEKKGKKEKAERKKVTAQHFRVTSVAPMKLIAVPYTAGLNFTLSALQSLLVIC